jgi:hypothetical protein
MVQTKPEWKNLEGVQEWSPELYKLLEQANKAAKQDEIGPRLDVCDLLTGFIQESWPQTPEMDKLDDLASQTVTDLMLATINERLGAIASRTAEYVKLAKDIDATAARSEAAADSIRLKGIQSLIDSATQTIASAKALAATFSDPNADEKKVLALVNQAVASVEKLRSGVAGLI